MKLFRNYVFPIATLSGSIIGVGFLSLPYVTVKAGLLPMLFYFIALTALIVCLHVIFGKISLKTPDYKRWPGFVGFYFGKHVKRIVLLWETVGLFGVLLAYLIVGGQFLTAIFGPFLGGNAIIYTLVFFIIVSTFIFYGVKIISKVNFVALSALLVISLLIVIRGFSHIKWGNISESIPLVTDWKNLFLPYGPLMFSLWGVGLIPEVEEMVAKNKKILRRIIVIGTLFAAVFYLIFTLLILGISGSATTPSALVGLGQILPLHVALIALCIGIITTMIAFAAHGLLLKKIFMYDVGIPKFFAWMLVCSVPLALFLLGFNSFIPLISFIGGFLLGIDGILILLMYRKIGGKKWVVYPLAIVFLLGMIYEIIYFI